MKSLLRHLLQALTITTLLHLLYIYTIDTPKPIYYCPLNIQDLQDWNENCYWSSSYVEAREKFVSLGNLLREVANNNDEVGVMNAKSIAYDVSDRMIEKYGSYVKYLATLKTVSGAEEIKSISPGRDAIDGLLVTIRVPDNSEEHIDIIHSSGVHGVEGYLGSAIQIRYIHDLILSQHNKGTRAHDISNYKLQKVLLIHAINPHGMRHHRRTNVNNVDLNRNALSSQEWEVIRKRDPNFAGYVDLDSTLNPFLPLKDGELFSWVDEARGRGFDGDISKLRWRDDRVKMEYGSSPHTQQIDSQQQQNTDSLGTSSDINEWITQSLEIVQLLPLILKAMLSRGYASTKRAFVSSQYLKPSGSQYGGGNHAYHLDDWENEVFAVKHAVAEFAGLLAGETNDEEKKNVFWIDVHTGLGKYGEYALLSTGSRVAGEVPSWVQTLTTHLGKTLNTGESTNNAVSSGYDQTLGFVNGPTLCPPPNCFAITQEFGTRNGVLVGLSMVLENKGYQVGNGEYGFSTSWAFCPRRLGWRRRVLRGGMQMLRGTLDF
jgi:hypothetical protein